MEQFLSLPKFLLSGLKTGGSKPPDHDLIGCKWSDSIETQPAHCSIFTTTFKYTVQMIADTLLNTIVASVALFCSTGCNISILKAL